MTETRYTVTSKTGPKGSVTGYVVREIDGDIIAIFNNRDWPSWRIARAKAYALFAKLEG